MCRLFAERSRPTNPASHSGAGGRPHAISALDKPVRTIYSSVTCCPLPETDLSKAILLILLALSAIQLIRPLGWPGLKKRSDFWKLALGGLIFLVFSISLIALFD